MPEYESADADQRADERSHYFGHGGHDAGACPPTRQAARACDAPQSAPRAPPRPRESVDAATSLSRAPCSPGKPPTGHPSLTHWQASIRWTRPRAAAGCRWAARRRWPSQACKRRERSPRWRRGRSHRDHRRPPRVHPLNIPHGTGGGRLGGSFAATGDAAALVACRRVRARAAACSRRRRSTDISATAGALTSGRVSVRCHL